ncbi:hypothetical protein GMDG_09024, partial [Pseudogymnoascus destructans 20631-21]
MRLKSILVSTTALMLMAGTAMAQQADPARLNEHTRVLASDEFEGRGVATPGEQKTVDYLVGQFAALGLEPGGPDGQWVQVAHLSRTQQSGPATIVARTPGGEVALRRGPDVLVASDRP